MSRPRHMKADRSIQVFFNINLLFLTILILSSLASSKPISNGNDVEIPHTTYSVPLFAAYQSHHAYIYIGSPAQRRLVIVDTGSKVLVFPCQPCRKCGRAHFSDHYFSLDTSTTDIVSHCDDCVFASHSKCQANKCAFGQSYAEGSTLRGYEVEDICWLGTDNFEESIKLHMFLAVPLSFGCETEETGLIANQYADGIMGLSMAENNIITQMYNSEVLRHNAFSLCLTRSAGIMSIGGTILSYPSEKHLEPMQTEPLLHRNNYYVVEIAALYVGEVAVGTTQTIANCFNSGKGTVIDSGTADMYLPAQIQNDFRNAWRSILGDEKCLHNKAKSYTYNEFQKLPNITFTLSKGYRWVIQPCQYMEEQVQAGNIMGSIFEQGWEGSKTFTNRIYLDEPRGCVLGANAMYYHDVLFDIENSRIGIASADCS